MKQTKERLPSVTSQEVTQEEKADRSTIFDDVFRTIAQKMPQLLIPLINEVFHTNYSEDTDFGQLRNEHYRLDHSNRSASLSHRVSVRKRRRHGNSDV